jgi:hypothetical protein
MYIIRIAHQEDEEGSQLTASEGLHVHMNLKGIISDEFWVAVKAIRSFIKIPHNYLYKSVK